MAYRQISLAKFGFKNQNTVKPVFKRHLYIQEKVSLHDRCPFATGSLTWGRYDTVLRKCPLITGCPLVAVSLEDRFYCIQTSPVKNNNDRGKSEKRKIAKNIYELRSVVGFLWLRGQNNSRGYGNRSVCLGSTKRSLDWMAIKYHLSFMAASLIRLHWGQVTFWGGQVDLIPICLTWQVTIKVSVYAWTLLHSSQSV